MRFGAGLITCSEPDLVLELHRRPASSLPDGTVLTPDLAIIGAGPAGISLALTLADTPYSVLLLESGGLEFDPSIQQLYKGSWK